ncbi:MAG: PTS sugar transporter subunit IIC [Elusimicrobiaceae bacterium]|nr:PTS sugar transporter subunit IIC [Elusimicrobiaceae bacterium]
MSEELLLFSLLTALMELDTVYAGQFMVSRPVIAGPILGLVAHNMAAGVILGLWFELLYAGYVPVGATIPPSGVISAAAAIAAADMFGVPLPAAFLAGLLAGALFGGLEEWMRRLRSGWNRLIAEQTARDCSVIDLWIVRSLLSQYALGFAFTLLFCLAAGPAAAAVMRHAPAQLSRALELGFSVVPWIGMVVLAESLRCRKGKNG